MIASPVSGSPRVAFSPHIRRSHESASSSPPPKAAPSMTAIVGIDSASKDENVDLKEFAYSLTPEELISFRSLRSAPAQKTPGTELVTRTTFTVSSASTFSTTPRSSLMASQLMAFLTSGRSSLSSTISQSGAESLWRLTGSGGAKIWMARAKSPWWVRVAGAQRPEAARRRRIVEVDGWEEVKNTAMRAAHADAGEFVGCSWRCIQRYT